MVNLKERPGLIKEINSEEVEVDDESANILDERIVHATKVDDEWMCRQVR